MSYITMLALALIALFAVAAWLAAWSRSDTRGRAMAIVLFMIGVPTAAAAVVESLGYAKPFAFVWELEPGRDYHVLAAKMVQDEGIWIYLDIGAREPRSLSFPWDNDTANAIQRVLDGAPEGAGGQFVMRYEPSLDTNAPQFHPPPQPPTLPEKHPLPPPAIYEQPPAGAD